MAVPHLERINANPPVLFQQLTSISFGSQVLASESTHLSRVGLLTVWSMTAFFVFFD